MEDALLDAVEQASATPGRTFTYPADAPSRPCPNVLRSKDGRCSFVKCPYDHDLTRINAFCIELIASNPAYSKAATAALVSKHGPDGGHEEHCAEYIRRSRDEGYGHPQPRGPRAPVILQRPSGIGPRAGLVQISTSPSAAYQYPSDENEGLDDVGAIETADTRPDVSLEDILAAATSLR